VEVHDAFDEGDAGSTVREDVEVRDAFDEGDAGQGYERAEMAE
jgi:hypothetical protein